jgi:hypothetical protein
MSYVNVKEVRNIIGVTETDIIPDSVIQQSIEFAEDELDRITFTTFLPKEDSGTVTSADSTSLTDSTQTFVSNQYQDMCVYIYQGTGKGQMREIVSNDSTSLTVAEWDTTPDTTSKYLITYKSLEEITLDGSGKEYMLLPNYPLIQVNSLTIDDTSITISSLNVYKDTGKIQLTNDSEKYIFSTNKKNVTISYYWGVLPEVKRGKIKLPSYVVRMVGIIAGLQAIAYQIGGTYNDLSTFSVPNLSGSIGQAYVNINATAERLLKELNTLKSTVLVKNPYMV